MKKLFTLSLSLLAATPLMAAEPETAFASKSFNQSYPAPLGLSLTGGWLDSWPHKHFSRGGTPFIHTFNLEPAFLDRDLFLDSRWTDSDEGSEIEQELELEWAITRRIGSVWEIPLVSLNPLQGDARNGLGDMAVAPRFLMVETKRMMLSTSLEVGLPTGDQNRDLGSGEVQLAPSVATWFDLGNWFALNLQVGTEHGWNSGDAELFYNFGLGYSFLTHGTKADVDYDHFPRGMANLIVEGTGRHGLSGPDDGRSTYEMLFGASYNVTGRWELRGGYQIPLGTPKSIDRGFTLSLIHHF